MVSEIRQFRASCSQNPKSGEKLLEFTTKFRCPPTEYSDFTNITVKGEQLETRVWE